MLSFSCIILVGVPDAAMGRHWKVHDRRTFLTVNQIDPEEFIFFDGSGLSGHDLVTPRATARLLAFAATQPWFAVWRASLPAAGEDGSLTSRFSQPPLKNHVFAKTGTLSEARALSGYLDAASGRTLIFSIMVGNHLPGTSADRGAMDKIVAAIQATQVMLCLQLKYADLRSTHPARGEQVGVR